MAATISGGASDAMTRANPFDHNGVYTVAGWVNIAAVDASFANGVFAIFRSADATDWHNMDEVYCTGAGAWNVRAIIASTGSAGSTAGTVSAGTWYHVALVRESATLLRLLINGASLATATTNIAGRATADLMILGNTWSLGGNAAGLNGRLAHLKIWTAALSAAELVNEMNAIRPIRRDSLWAWYPMLAGLRTEDWSANGRTLTESGTVADGVDPGIPFGASPIYPMQDGGDGLQAEVLTDFERWHLFRRGKRRWVA